MVLFIFGFWLTVDLILGDINLLHMLGVTPVLREVRHLMEGFDAEQVPSTSLEYVAKILIIAFFCAGRGKDGRGASCHRQFSTTRFFTLIPVLNVLSRSQIL